MRAALLLLATWLVPPEDYRTAIAMVGSPCWHCRESGSRLLVRLARSSPAWAAIAMGSPDPEVNWRAWRAIRKARPCRSCKGALTSESDDWRCWLCSGSGTTLFSFKLPPIPTGVKP